MASSTESKLKKLSLFALDLKTALPIARVPFYAEIGVRATLELPPVAVEDRCDQVMRSALNLTDRECVDSPQCWNRVAEVLREGLSRHLTSEARSELAADSDTAVEFLSRVIRRAREARRGATLLGLDLGILRLLLDNAIRADAEENDVALTALPAVTPIMWAHPMGILATDHAGISPLDLTRLPDTVFSELEKAIAVRRLDPNATLDTTIWVYPMAREDQRYDALAQGRFAHDAIVLKLELDKPELPEIISNFGILSLQNPDLTDWRISPSSFPQPILRCLSDRMAARPCCRRMSRSRSFTSIKSSGLWATTAASPCRPIFKAR